MDYGKCGFEFAIRLMFPILSISTHLTMLPRDILTMFSSKKSTLIFPLALLFTISACSNGSEKPTATTTNKPTSMTMKEVRDMWNTMPESQSNTYRYQISDGSVMALEHEYWTFYYENGTLVGRDFFVYDLESNNKKISWSEGPKDIGTNRNGATWTKGRPIEQIFTECENSIDSTHPNFSQPIIKFDKKEFSCLRYDNSCEDDCTRGVSFRLCPSKTELAEDSTQKNCVF